MKSFAMLFALAVLTTSAFAANDPKPTSLKEATRTVLYDKAKEYSDPTWFPPSTLGGGQATNYCASSLNSNNTMCLMSHVGSLSLTDNTFGLMATGAVPVAQSWGMFTYGVNPITNPIVFGNGFLCIYPFPPGIYKMPTQNLGTGTIVRSMTTHPVDFSLFTPGSTWYFQFWYRDRFQLPSRFNLSDGLEVSFAP